MKEPKLILCDDWRGIATELRKQLKPHGLTVKFKTRRDDDRITVHVETLIENKEKTLVGRKFIVKVPNWEVGYYTVGRDFIPRYRLKKDDVVSIVSQYRDTVVINNQYFTEPTTTTLIALETHCYLYE